MYKLDLLKISLNIIGKHVNSNCQSVDVQPQLTCEILQFLDTFCMLFYSIKLFIYFLCVQVM